ncbi:MAG: hybrid sensor histidine kinase/response regulator [Hyphomicrobiaceae bacterium]|nr:hybrid sensor histidine kinase/response regulator [Hyphomicrobiaceae bacterium]
MIDGWIIITAALAYLGFLFGVAYFGDQQASQRASAKGRPAIYALSLAVYCTSWTFFGSVGLSATTGYNFIPVYIGPIIMFAVGWPLVIRIIRLSKTQNITSIADFIAARYGKNPALAAIVTVIAVAGTLPYIALQLKAVSESVTTIIGPVGGADAALSGTPLGDIAFIVAVLMAIFAILFGTRHIDATEHQEGLMLAIATESVVKILAFLLVGAYITFSMFGGLGPLLERAAETPQISELFTRGFNGGAWITVTFLSLVCIILLPRQFHVSVVENNSENEVRRAAWLFPLYLVAINLFVVPIAIAGLLTFPNGEVSADMFVLALPLSDGARFVTLAAFIGGLSAATAMVIVATVALSIMVSNDLVVPLLLRRRFLDVTAREDLSTSLLNIRRSAIFAILILAYVFYRLIGGAGALASIGLLSFAAIAQFAPAFFGGLVWRRATARGAIAGIVAGFVLWAYTLLLPAFVQSGLLPNDILVHGPFGLGLLKPQELFNFEFEPVPHGVFWSLLFNVVAYITVSLLRSPEPIERLQANVFIQDELVRPQTPGGFRLWRTSITVEELQNTAGRYVGEERAKRSFREYASSRNEELHPSSEADVHLLRYTEHLLASAVGTASSRLVLSLLLRRRAVGVKSAQRLLDDASEAIQYNRDLLQSALDQVRQGISVYDKDMRLICWNRQFREILNLPQGFGRVGVPLDEIMRYCAKRGDLGDGNTEDLVSDRIHKLAVTQETFQERLSSAGQVLEVRTNSMPQGGIVTTYTDITDRVEAAEALSRANETLERRVRERTAELTKVNRELAKAKAKADDANLGKTRFLAAASHDILQPLNAARLYTTSLAERKKRGEEGRLIRNVDASLEAVEEILGTLLDISRLDAGAMKPEISVFPVDDLLMQLKLEFEPMAKDKGLDFRVHTSSLSVMSDRRLLRRVLQNLISNAIKYTHRGRVILGCRRRSGNRLAVQICDTGPGIPKSKQRQIFKEFQRLNTNSDGTHGLGLGLSIVERIGRVLDHDVQLESRNRRGSVFSVVLPVAEPRVQRRTSRPRAAAGQIAGCTVLCLDNEPSILEGMETLLSGWDCHVLKATGSSDAVAQVKASPRPPEIILADYHLDGETGLDVVRAVRKELGYDVPAVVITADRSREVQELVRAEGLQLLRKPLRPASLRAVMAQSRIRQAAAE